jgi:DNA modification methylase
MAGKARKSGERKYVVADSRAAVRSLRVRPKAIITSPPYFDVRKYPASTQIGYGQKLEDFLADVRTIFKDLLETAHSRAAMWIVADDIRKDGQLIPLPYRFAQCAVDAGWTWQASFVWRKDRTYPWLQEGRLRKQHETILLLSKSKDLPLQIDRLREVENITEWWLRYPERYNPYGRAPSDVWLEKIPIQGTWGKPFLKHECPFPPRLVERMIELSTNRGDWVLDPFAGTGVVAAVAAAMDRNGYAIDVVETFRTHFENDVVPAVAEWWAARKLEREREVRKRRTFFQANIALRLVKYAKVLQRHLNSPTPYLRGVWVDAGKIRIRSPWAKPIITLLSDGTKTADEIEKAATELAGKAPLSKFGIDAKVQVRLARRFTGSQTAHLYSLNGLLTPLGEVTKSAFVELCVEGKSYIASTEPVEPKDIASVDTRYLGDDRKVASVARLLKSQLQLFTSKADTHVDAGDTIDDLVP